VADDTQLLYLEPDDEITTVVRRLREADAHRLVLIASGRTKATTSAVALRLLAQVAAEEGREVVLVADPAARSLAAEAGIPAFASVADANAEGAVALTPAPAPRAPIHVVRGEPAPASMDQAAANLVPVPTPTARMDETQAVPTQPAPPRARPRPTGGRRGPPSGRSKVPMAALAAVLVLLVLAGAAIAMVLPAATVTLRPQAVLVTQSYAVRPDVHPSDAEPLSSTKDGEATGHRTKRTAATGIVTFINYSADNVFVPSGTPVSAGGQINFRTTADVTVPDSFFGFVGIADAPIEALERGPGGNVEANAIDQIEDKDVDRALRGAGGPNERRVRNENPIGGGDEVPLLIVRRSDITRVTQALKGDLERQLTDLRAEADDRIYPGADAPAPTIEVPKGLIGHASEEPYTFELTGTLVDDQPFVLTADVVAAARQRLLGDDNAIPQGTSLDSGTIELQPGAASLQGDAIVVQTGVNANALPNFDRAALPGMVSGKTSDEAIAALRPIGPATIDLWPPWVDRVPGLEWRVRVDIRPAVPAQ
jgi:Baseplate J-like protein